MRQLKCKKYLVTAVDPVLFSDMRSLPPSRDRPNVFRKPHERAEYTTESEVEESELDQTRHNRCGVLRPTAYSDSDRSVDSRDQKTNYHATVYIMSTLSLKTRRTFGLL